MPSAARREAPPHAVPDTLLGVCAALGDVAGLPAIIARLAFIAAMLAGWLGVTLAVYLSLALAFRIALDHRW